MSQNDKKEICIVIAGSVDSGKSTFIGVMENDKLDDGNGLMRNTVAKHEHEIKTGRTSDISVRTIDSCTNSIVLVDLCGHNKYLKTTLFGITGYFPDYAIVMVAANRGVLPMTKEHLGILLYMKIPMMIVVTKVDIAPKAIYERTIKTINKILKIPVFKKKPVFINDYNNSDGDSNKDLESALKYIPILKDSPTYVPIISVSNTTGYYIDVAKKFILSLKPRNKWNNVNIKGSVFYIDSTFSPPGVGLVLSGIVKGDSIKLGKEMLLGPYNKQYIPVTIWSMHNNTRKSIKLLSNSFRGCVAVRINKKYNFDRSKIRKGMVLLSNKSLINRTCYEFKADIEILNHSTTIKNNYSPIIHCGIIKQSAKISILNEKKLRTGDTAHVKFTFKNNPEFIETGMIFFFREGKTRGVGIVSEIYPIGDT